MKDFRFYLEHESPAAKRRGEHNGNVTATYGPWYLSGQPATVTVECIAAVFDRPNSQVCGCSASRDYLAKNCKRISEARARKIHPNLFAYLDNIPD